MAIDEQQRDDELFADELIRRLNALLGTHPDVGAVLGELVEYRVPCSAAVVDHPTIQLGGADATVGMLGILNGMTGVISSGPRSGWGLITAAVEADGRVSRFLRTPDTDPVATAVDDPV